MNKIIVKRGFEHHKIYYGAGKEVPVEIAELYPDHIKMVIDSEIEQVVEKEVKKEEPIKVEKVEEPVKKKVGKKK